MIKCALLSFWHVHADDYYRQATEHPDTEIVAIWDEISERGQKEAEARGVTFYESLDQLLANDEIDAVIISTPTNMHRDVMIAAAKAGKHIFTEKVIAPTWREVNDILNAIEEAKVKLTVSLPWLNHRLTLAIQDILNQGVLGELTLVRTRLSHNGATKGWLPEHFYNLEQCGGGALIDLGCHPMYLTRLFLGLPRSLSAHYGYVTGREVEDNAVAILQYDHGALGVVEAGFVNDHSPFSIEIHGKKGTLHAVMDDQLRFRSTLVKEGQESEVDPQDFPEALPPAFAQWVEHIKADTEAEENVGIAVDLTKLMEAANLSAKQGRVISLEEL